MATPLEAELEHAGERAERGILEAVDAIDKRVAATASGDADTTADGRASTGTPGGAATSASGGARTAASSDPGATTSGSAGTPLVDHAR